VGTALAASEGKAHAPSAVAALAGGLLIQIGTNFANDLHDFERGADTDRRIGPTRATASGLVTPHAMRAAVGIVFACAMLVGVYLVARGGLPIVAVGLASILAGIAYTGGPRPLGYMGLGDPFVFAFFGLVPVAATYFVQAHALPARAVWAGVPMGLLATAILDVNNLRDIETDRDAGKRTLAVRMGRRGARAEYVLLLALAAVLPAVLVAAGIFRAGVLLATASIAAGWPQIRRVRCDIDGPSLNRALAGTARLQAIYAAAFSLGLFL
jgi:1,4-dihydroxy-2-naphthoate octaprenyltransferase